MPFEPQPFLFQNRIGETGAWPIWVIDHHYSDGNRTAIGKLVYQAKYLYDETSSAELQEIVKTTVKNLIKLKLPITLFDPEHSADLGRVEAVVAVPFFGFKQLSLPHLIATAISQALDIEDLSNKVRKVRPTDAAKQESNPVVDSSVFEVEPLSPGQRILLVDDLYRSGATLESLAVQVRRSSPRSLSGFCATKVRVGMAFR